MKVQTNFNTKSIVPKILPGPNHLFTTDNVLQHIEYYKTKKPSIYAREIRDQLINDGVCDETNIPLSRTIAHVLTAELNV